MRARGHGVGQRIDLHELTVAPFRLSSFLVSTLLMSAVMLTACGGGGSDAATPIATAPTTPTTPVDPTPAPPRADHAGGAAGKWTTGDLHVHTIQSDDTQQISTLDQVLAKALQDQFGLDWVAMSDHLRLSSYDNDGHTLRARIPFSEGMAKYQVPRIKALQAAGTYADKTIFSSFEWDMPSHDHGNVGILTDDPMSAAALKAVSQFEYLFTNRAAVAVPRRPTSPPGGRRPASRLQHARRNAQPRSPGSRTTTPTRSYLQINHPSRNLGKYTIAQLREMNDLAPNIVFSLEGMVGNQMEPDRGGYTQAANPRRPTWSRAPTAASTTWWRRWAAPGTRCCPRAATSGTWPTRTTTSPCNGNNSSGYAPGEYSKNYLFGDIKDPKSLLAAMRKGKLFAVNGDLINALDFRVAKHHGAAPRWART